MEENGGAETRLDIEASATAEDRHSGAPQADEVNRTNVSADLRII